MMACCDNDCKCSACDWLAKTALNDNSFSHRFEVAEPVSDSLTNHTGSNHYKQFQIQPGYFLQVNKNIGWFEGCIIKRACRHHSIKDLYKIIDEAIKILDIDYNHNFNIDNLDEVING